MDVLNAIGDIFYGGIQPNIPGNEGPDCVAFLSKGQLLFETLLGTTLVVLFSLCGAKTYTLPAKVTTAGKDPLLKKVLLVVLSVVFAIEIVYKVCSRQLLYLLNPCHVLVHYIYGAAIALLFPKTDSRLLTYMNLNYFLCLASVDPFRGPYYRIIGLFHQTLCLLFVGKVYTLVVKHSHSSDQCAEDAQVICCQLGFSGTSVAFSNAYFGAGSSNQPIWLDVVNVGQCLSGGWGIHNCLHMEDAGVRCSGRQLVRLASGPIPTEGRVELYYNGSPYDQKG
eukprot:Em0007g878a